MDEADIAQTLGLRLSTMTDVPDIVWENKDVTGQDKPYLAVQMVRVSRRSPSLNGGGTVSRGFMQVTVVADENKWAFPAERLAQNIADRFQKGLRLSGTGGRITIMQDADIKSGFNDGVSWRIPIQIDYWAS